MPAAAPVPQVCVWGVSSWGHSSLSRTPAPSAECSRWAVGPDVNVTQLSSGLARPLLVEACGLHNPCEGKIQRCSQRVTSLRLQHDAGKIFWLRH